MSSSTLKWQPESNLEEQIISLSEKTGKSPEAIITEAVLVYLESRQVQKAAYHEKNDPLIGLFSGSPDLATQSEEILQQTINPESGWTWK